MKTPCLLLAATTQRPKMKLTMPYQQCGVVHLERGKCRGKKKSDKRQQRKLSESLNSSLYFPLILFADAPLRFHPVKLSSFLEKQFFFSLFLHSTIMSVNGQEGKFIRHQNTRAWLWKHWIFHHRHIFSPFVFTFSISLKTTFLGTKLWLFSNI